MGKRNADIDGLSTHVPFTTVKIKGEKLDSLDKEPVWEYDTKTGQHRIVVGDQVGEWAAYVAIAQLTTPRGVTYVAFTDYFRGDFQPGRVYQMKLVPSRERVAGK